MDPICPGLANFNQIIKDGDTLRDQIDEVRNYAFEMGQIALRMGEMNEAERHAFYRQARIGLPVIKIFDDTLDARQVHADAKAKQEAADADD